MICQCSYIDAMRNPCSTFLLSKAPEQSLSSEGDDKFFAARIGHDPHSSAREQVLFMGSDLVRAVQQA